MSTTRVRRTLDQKVQLAESLAKNNKNNKGKIPSATWLREHGYMGLYITILNNKKAFSHLERDENNGGQQRIENTRIKYQTLAKRLSKNGVLPSRMDLVERGYSQFVNYAKSHPDYFDEYTFKPNLNRGYTPVEDRIKEAEVIAKKHGGRLPSTMEMIRKYGFAFYKCIRRNPDKFAHIPKTTENF